MKLYKNIIAVAALILIPVHGFSQQQRTEDLKIGEKVPNMVIDSIINREQRAVKISDLYKSKLLIINFWATWCVPCVGEMAMLDTLKSKYRSSLNVLSVTDDHSSIVDGFLIKHKNINSKNLLITTDSKNLSAYFKHRSIPHNVWIDSTGTIIAITDNIDLNESNIKKYLGGKMPKVILKHDNQTFSFARPLHVEDSALVYRSIITRFNPGLNSGTATNPFYSKRVIAWNIPLADLFWMAYTKQISSITNWNMVEVQTRDSLKFFAPKAVPELFKRSKYFDPNKTYKEQYRAYSFDHDFCYELRLPDSVSSESFREFIFQDLERFFNTTATIENRKIKCVIVGLNHSSILKKSSPLNYQTPVIQRFATKIICKNIKLDEFLMSLNDEFNHTGIPFINHTGIDFGLDLVIDISKGGNTIAHIIQQLSEVYGLNFDKIERHDYPVLVLRDK
jgi:thiol-disulfide isomerase/thioredoxin